MADASNAQTDFRGGEFSPYAQGQFADPEYKRGMNVCRNGHPIETGAWTRRVGTRHKGYTRKGQPAKVIQFSFSQSAPYDMEFTDGKLRFYDSHGPVISEEPRRVTNISAGSPARVSTVGACSEITPWATGDQVMFFLLADGAPAAAGVLLGRQFSIVIDNDEDHFFLYDGITQEPIDGSTISFSSTNPMVVARVYEIDTPYDDGSWKKIKAVQDGDQVLILHPNHRPYSVFAPIDGGNMFTFTASQPLDGPYLDPPIDGSFLTVSGVTGTINCEIIYPTWSSAITYKNGTRFLSSFQSRSGSSSISVQYARDSVVLKSGVYYVSIQDGNTNHAPPNATWWKALPAGQLFGPTGLTANDVGRSVRLLAQPADWDGAVNYVTNDLTNYLGAYYVALQNNNDKVPGTDPDNWGVASNAIKWTWGIITAVSSATQFSLSIQGDDLLYNQNVTVFRFGAWSDSTRWPSCGTFHEGRFWLGGAIKNRFDASAVFGNTLEFTPTAPDGTVSDANGISYTLKSPSQNLLLWMIPDNQGILMGTAQAEWLLRSSANNDPITPTSIQAHDFTSIGSADVEAVRTGMTVAFVQRYGKKLIDYVGDPFGNFAGLNLSERSKHLTKNGITRIAYQHELVPTIWALTGDNTLIGTTYKRESVMPGQMPVFNGWHRHDLGSGFDVIDICASSSPDGLLDSITLVTQDPVSGVCQIETLTEMFDETSDVKDAWFVDDATIPSSALVTTQNSIDGVLLTGYGRLEGEVLSVFFGGADLGDFTVTNGTMFLPFTTTFTLAFVQGLNADDYTFSFRVLYNNPTAATMKMMEFPPLGSPFLDAYTYLNFGSHAIVDWKRDRVTFPLLGTGPYSGLLQYRISTGELIRYAQTSYIFGAPNPAYYDNSTIYQPSPMVVGSDGKMYIARVGGSKGADPVTTPSEWLRLFQFSVPAAYAGGTTYAVGDRVTSAGSIYESLQASNTGHTPASSPTFWKFFYPVPAAWNKDTVYGTGSTVTSAGHLTADHIYIAKQVVPAGTGDPHSLNIDDNPYWEEDVQWQVGEITTTGLGLDFNGDIYMKSSLGSQPWQKINGKTLKIAGTVTAAPGQTVPVPDNYIVPLRVLSNNFRTETDFILYTTGTGPAGISRPSATLMQVTNLLATEAATFVFDEGSSGPYACPGSPAIGVGQAFCLTRPPTGQPTPYAVGLYEIDVFSNDKKLVKKVTSGLYKAQDPNKGIYGNYGPSGSSLRKAGTILPSDIDPLWKFFIDFGGLIYDQRDGNVITTVTTRNPTLWSSGNNFNSPPGNILSYTLYSDDNIYVFQIGATPTWSSIVTYALNAVVSNGSSNPTLYKSLANGNLNHVLTDVTKWAVYSPEPTIDTAYWSLVGPKATTFSYMVKFTTDCAQVLWRIPNVDFGTTAINSQYHNIANGHLVFVRTLGGGSFDIVRINTVAGSMTATPLNGVAPLGAAQVYNDLTGDIIMYPQFDGTASGAPTTVNPVGGTTPSSFTSWGRFNIQPDQLVYTVPGVAGFTYTSQGQTLRPVTPAETGARNGPAFGKTRRNHRYAAMVANTAGISFGSEFTKVRPALFKSRSGKGALLQSAATLYTGEHSDTVEGDYDLDGMLCWQITRPLPATVGALGGFLQTQDR